MADQRRRREQVRKANARIVEPNHRSAVNARRFSFDDERLCKCGSAIRVSYDTDGLCPSCVAEKNDDDWY